MKYLVITLAIQDGEHEHTHRILHTTDCKNIKFAAQYYAAHYWGYAEYDKVLDWWELDGGAMAISVYKVVEITKKEYNLMFKYLG